MIHLYTFAHKRPDFIEMQIKSFSKNIEDGFKFTVFNNAVFNQDKLFYNEINKICKNNNIECIDVKVDENLIKRVQSYNDSLVFNKNNIYSNANIACAYPLCYAWENFISKNNGLISIIDSDMFIINKINFNNLLKNNNMYFILQGRGHVSYMWNGIFFCNLDTLINPQELDWWAGKVEDQPTDVGGRTYFYLKKYGDKLNIKHLSSLHVKQDPECDFSPVNYEIIGTQENRFILHYRGGSNWDNKSKDYHEKKTKFFKKKLNQ